MAIECHFIDLASNSVPFLYHNK